MNCNQFTIKQQTSLSESVFFNFLTVKKRLQKDTKNVHKHDNLLQGMNIKMFHVKQPDIIRQISPNRSLQKCHGEISDIMRQISPSMSQ